MTKTSVKQQSLAIILVLSFLSGFVMIIGAEVYYESTNIKEQLFISNSDTEFITVSVSDNYIYSDVSAIDTHARNLKGGVVTFISLTPAYLGNNTWGLSVPTFDDPPYDFCDAYFQMNIPDMENWILTDIFMNWSVGTQIYQGGMTILHFNAPFPLTDGGSASDKSAETPLLYQYGLSNPITTDYQVPLNKALKIYTDSQSKGYTSLECAIQINSLSVPWESFAWTFNVEIFGYQQKTFTLKSLISTCLVIATIMNFAVIIFMTDIIDLSGYKKDIPHRRRKNNR